MFWKDPINGSDRIQTEPFEYRSYVLIKNKIVCFKYSSYNGQCSL